MHLFSYLAKIRNGLIAAFRNHPLAMLCGLAGAGCGIAAILVHSYQGPLGKLTAILWLGITLCLSADFLSQGGLIRKNLRVLVRLAPLPLLALAWLSIRHLAEDMLFLRMALWGIASHCLVAVSPFLNPRGWGTGEKFDDEDLRGFNLLLFERALQAVLFTQFLFFGIAVALLACDSLFGFKVNEKLYPSLWFAIVGVFQTAYLLNEIPKSPEQWRRQGLHPSLAFLPRYILLPLGLVYLIILYAYGVKALVMREWPIGWASSLILVYSGLMLLTLLLFDKSGTEKSREAHGKLTRILFGALAPLLILLYLAVGRRIADYGITEERYLGIALAVWLTVMCVVHLKAGRTMVIGIPLSLGVSAFLISFGPWGATAVSVRSQWSRLEQMLVKAERLEAGRLRKRETPVPSELQRNISSQLDWLQRRKETDRLRAWLARPQDACPDCVLAWDQWPGSPSVMHRLGLEYHMGSYRYPTPNECMYSAKSMHGSLSIAGFEQVMWIGDFWSKADDNNTWLLKGPEVQALDFAWRQGDFRIGLKNQSETILDWQPLFMRMSQLQKAGVDKDSIPAESLYVDLNYAHRQWKFLFGSVTLDTVGKPIQVKTFTDGMVFIGPEKGIGFP